MVAQMYRLENAARMAMGDSVTSAGLAGVVRPRLSSAGRIVLWGVAIAAAAGAFAALL